MMDYPSGPGSSGLERRSRVAVSLRELSSEQVLTLGVCLVELMHVITPVFNWLFFVREKGNQLGNDLSRCYIVFSVISFLIFIVVVSPIYMWSFQYPDPQLVARRRRNFAMMINFFASDLPFFVMEVKIMWRWRAFHNAVHGLTFIFCVISFGLSGLKTWYSFLLRFTQQFCEPAGSYSSSASSRRVSLSHSSQFSRELETPIVRNPEVQSSGPSWYSPTPIARGALPPAELSAPRQTLPERGCVASTSMDRLPSGRNSPTYSAHASNVGRNSPHIGPHSFSPPIPMQSSGWGAPQPSGRGGAWGTGW